MGWDGIYNYDSVGNIQKRTLGQQTVNYAYDANNQLTAVSGAVNRTFGYDARGNVIDNGLRSLTYNLAGQLIGSGAHQRRYDGYDRWVKASDEGKTTYSVYDHDGHLLITQQSGEAMQDNIYRTLPLSALWPTVGRIGP